MNDNLKQGWKAVALSLNRVTLAFEQLQFRKVGGIREAEVLPENKIEKCIERTKKKLFKIIVEYNIEHRDDKEKTSAYRLADNLYREYKSLDKKDGLTLHEIEVLNKFYKERT